eukprot:299275-Rhodomonas_salina.2
MGSPHTRSGPGTRCTHRALPCQSRFQPGRARSLGRPGSPCRARAVLQLRTTLPRQLGGSGA